MMMQHNNNRRVRKPQCKLSRALLPTREHVQGPRAIGPATKRPTSTLHRLLADDGAAAGQGPAADGAGPAPLEGLTPPRDDDDDDGGFEEGEDGAANGLLAHSPEDDGMDASQLISVGVCVGRAADDAPGPGGGGSGGGGVALMTARVLASGGALASRMWAPGAALACVRSGGGAGNVPLGKLHCKQRCCLSMSLG